MKMMTTIMESCAALLLVSVVAANPLPSVEFDSTMPSTNITATNKTVSEVPNTDNVSSNATTVISPTNISATTETIVNAANETKTSVDNETIVNAANETKTSVANETIITAANVSNIVVVNGTKPIAANETKTSVANETIITAANVSNIVVVNGTKPIAANESNVSDVNETKTTAVNKSNSIDVNETHKISTNETNIISANETTNLYTNNTSPTTNNTWVNTTVLDVQATSTNIAEASVIPGNSTVGLLINVTEPSPILNVTKMPESLTSNKLLQKDTSGNSTNVVTLFNITIDKSTDTTSITSIVEEVSVTVTKSPAEITIVANTTSGIATAVTDVTEPMSTPSTEPSDQESLVRRKRLADDKKLDIKARFMKDVNQNNKEAYTLDTSATYSLYRSDNRKTQVKAFLSSEFWYDGKRFGVNRPSAGLHLVVYY